MSLTVKDLEYATTPESVGVSSREIQALVDDFIENGQEIHSLMVLRHGKVACELYRSPFNADSPHTMYSVSKSIAATAIGIAIDEGRLTLETRFLDIFPEAIPKKADEYFEKLNVYHLLTMQSGKTVSPLSSKARDSWFEDFVKAPWGFEPGTEFLYVNENVYILCAIINRLTGQSVVEYLTPRLFEPLGIDVPFWATCPRGIEAGGWGLFLKTKDLAKIMLTYQQKGIYMGKRILSQEWVENATKKHSDNSVSQSASDSVAGYGFCFWRCAGYENAYRADGLFSQFGIVFEDLDACIICTGGDIVTQGTRDTIWRHAPKCFIDDDLSAQSVPVSMPEYAMLPIMPRSEKEAVLNEKNIIFNRSVILNVAGFPTSVVPFPGVYMEKDRAGNFNNVRFSFFDDFAEMEWTEGDEENTVQIGLDGQYRISKVTLGQTPYTAYSHGAWITDNELEIRIRLIETVAERILHFDFSGRFVTMKPSSNPDIQMIGESMRSKIKDVIKQPVIQPVVSSAVPHLAPVVDMALHGILRDRQSRAENEDE